MKNRIISESSIELCPVCGEHYTSICKCPIGERRCKNSHVWFMCPVHKTHVIGKSNHSDPFDPNKCYCKK